ncbi:hypothetical protein Pmani_038920 [Petrolisthes manimaculis]|uniref:Uncharacterized protein n=1 Tax=Petrolisthes manimaculis TaxID=1843537 RepID=A0AAE1NDF9_9EUCA|nr:hypothetical protein Pmani_038920 [Petrolisthes manimaculis]
MVCVLTNLLRHFGANEVMKGVGLGVVASSSWDQHTHPNQLINQLVKYFGANEVMKAATGDLKLRLPGPNLSRLLEVLLEFVECCQVCNTVKMFPCCNTQVTWIKMKQQQQQ